MDVDSDLKFWCVIVDSDSQPFQVTVSGNKNIDELKDIIHEKKYRILSNVNASDLILWKLKKPQLIRPMDTLMSRALPKGSDLSDNATKIEVSDDVLDAFPNHLPDKNLHIIVIKPPERPATAAGDAMQVDKLIIEPNRYHVFGEGQGTLRFADRRGPRQRTITPPQSSKSIDEIQKLIEKELEPLRWTIEEFLRNPEPRTWVPPDNVDLTQNSREFLTNLRLPTYANGNPSLLYHNLHLCDGDEVEEMFGDGIRIPMFVCNTSGSGKSRRILEVLTKHWGFYFVAAPDINGVGVSDLYYALEEVANYYEWVSDLDKVPAERRRGQDKCNSQIAARLFQKVFAARIVIFRFFLQLAIDVDGGLQEKHKRIWLLFQLTDDLHPSFGVAHPFHRILVKCLDDASDQALKKLILSLEDIRTEYPILESKFVIGLDEAQQATRLYPRSFISSTSDFKYRSILREMAKVFTNLPFKFIVSGTGLSLVDVKDALASGVSKHADAVKLVHKLGMFDTWLKLNAFLKCYIPASFLESLSGYRLQHRIEEYLLGRYRFTVSFVEYLLMNGLESPHQLLTAYIQGHTGCLPGDTGAPFDLYEPKLRTRVGFLGFEWDRLEEDQAALQEAAQIVHSHLTKGKRPCFAVTDRLVEYGIAHLREAHRGHIVEPLAFLSLLQWLESSKNLSARALLRSRLGSSSSRGTAYEELMVLYLLRILHDPTTFNMIFNFFGTPPSWASYIAQIVARRDGRNVKVGTIVGDSTCPVAIKAPQNPSLGVVDYADNIVEVLSWIKDSNASAVLVPTNLFGPDVMLRCEGDVMLMGQLKSYTTGNEESLDARTIQHALTSLNEDHWFKSSPSVQRKQLIEALKQYHILRFVGDYPLPPCLELKASSVQTALAALGQDVTLATIKLDTFKNHFITEDHARNVLSPLEEALARKRNPDEISCD